MIKKKSKKKPSPAQLAARAKFIKAVKSGVFRKKGKSKKKPAKKLSGLTTYIAKKAIQRKLKKSTGAKLSGTQNQAQELISTGKKLDALFSEMINLRENLKNAPRENKSQIRATIANKKRQFIALKKYLNTLAKFK